MADLEQHLILHRLDDPLRILYWTVDEALVAILSPLIGGLMDHPLLGMGFAVGGAWGLIRLKKRLGGGTLKHALYWYFPHNHQQLKITPPSYIREYIG